MPANSPHLLAYLSAHGFGHLAQSAVVLNRLRQQLPSLRLTLITALPEKILSAHLNGDWRHIQEPADIGMRMIDAMQVDRAASAAAYREFHTDWDTRVEREAARQHELGVDAVFSNIAPLGLAGAAYANIPAAALCSINWVDIYAHYLADQPEASRLLQQMRVAYSNARLFLQPAPSMPMTWLQNRRPIDPIARLGNPAPDTLHSRLGVPQHKKIVLVALGGIDTQLALEHWHSQQDIFWLLPDDWPLTQGAAHIEAADMSFIDLLCSVDTVLTKPGYGTFAEAACNGTPVLYFPRDGWPESPFLTEWLHQHNRALEISPALLEQTDISDPLQDMLAMHIPDRPRPDGIQQAANALMELLSA